MTKISEARERYEEKVCKDYLGIPESYCTDEFSKLISNMKAGIMAVKGSPERKSWVCEDRAPSDVEDSMLDQGFNIIDRRMGAYGEPTGILMEKNGNLYKLKKSRKGTVVKKLTEE